MDYDIFFKSSSAYSTHYTKGDNVQLISIQNSDDSYFQDGMISLYNVQSSQTIGDECMIFIDDTLQFNGYVSRKQQTIDKGVNLSIYQLVGKTYDLWRYHTNSDTEYSGYTSYIASSLVHDFCHGISGTNIDVTTGIELLDMLDLSNMTIGDAIVQLIGYDGFRFYINNDSELIYYEPGVDTYAFTIEEADILEMTPIEEADEDLVNDVLVIGGSGYSEQTNVSETHPSYTCFPSGVLVAQQFIAKDNILSSIKPYLNRTLDPNQPTTLNFEVWENTEKIVFDDDFDNYNYLNSGASSHYNMEVEDSKLQLSPSVSYTESGLYGNTKWNANYYVCGLFRPTQVMTPTMARLYSYILIDGGNAPQNFIIEIQATGSTGVPDGVSIVTSDAIKYWYNDSKFHGDDTWYTFSSSPTLQANKTYALVKYGGYDGGNVEYTRVSLGSDAGVTATVKKVGCSLDNSTWSMYSYSSNYWINGVTRCISGCVESLCYSGAKDYDCQYMKITLSGAVSSSRIYLSGSNDSGQTWITLTDGVWGNFGSQDSAVKVKYIFSSNGTYTPKIGSAELVITDDTGAIDGELFEDTFSDSTYLSSQTSNYMTIDDEVHTGKLVLSGSNGYSTWAYAVDASESDFSQGVSNIENLIQESGYAYKNNDHQGDIGYVYFSITGQVGDGGSLYPRVSKFKTYTYTQNLEHNYRTEIQEIALSGTWTPNGWEVVNTDAIRISKVGYGYRTVEGDLAKSGYVYSGVKRIRLEVLWVESQNTWYWCKFLTHPIYNNNGYIKSVDDKLAANVDMTSLLVEPEGVTNSGYIKYSGSLDSGSNWTSLTPNISTLMDVSGKHAVLWYNFSPSGSWPSYPSSNTLLPATPMIDSIKLTASISQGGGIPKSGTKIEWSDDITFIAGDVPYPPEYTSWQTYTTPKLSGLTIGDKYWLVFNHTSGSSKYWDYYLDTESTYDGKLAYSWKDGVSWSSNSTDPTDVPAGNMTFKLGWVQGDITATASNQDSIDIYGRHFKKIVDSNITTLEVAQARADEEVRNMEIIPKKGTVTIEGRTDMSQNYRFSSNLTNFGITDIWDIKQYSQIIDQNGFRTVINYGKPQFDIAKKLVDLEKEVNK